MHCFNFHSINLETYVYKIYKYTYTIQQLQQITSMNMHTNNIVIDVSKHFMSYLQQLSIMMTLFGIFPIDQLI